MKKRLISAILSICLFIQGGCLVSASEFADSKIDNENYGGEKNYTCATDSLTLFCTNENIREYQHGSVITKQFKIESYYDTDSYDISLISYDGIDIIKKPTIIKDDNAETLIEIDFIVLDSCEIGNICFEVKPVLQDDKTFNEQTRFEQNIYCYHDADSDYVSTIYLDCLYEYSDNLKKYLCKINRQGEVIENERHNIEPINRVNSNEEYNLSVSGYVSWTDKNYGVHAAENIKVELYSVNGSTDSYIGTTYTNSVGAYSISFPSHSISKNVKIKILSEGTNISVKNPFSSYETYEYESSTFEVYGFARLSYTASNTTNIGQSLSIQQAMAMANEYIYSLESNYLNNISVYFPNGNGSTSFFDRSDVDINIAQGSQFEWDTLQHEYGHYVQYCYDIENNPGGSHALNSNMADTYMTDNKPENDVIAKDLGTRLAWAEGWATYFAINLQKEMSAASLNIPNVGDTHYQNVPKRIDEDMETPLNSRLKGEANESTVCAVLYDITDGINTSEDDYIYISSSNIWNIIKTNHCKTLSEFVSAFYSAGYSPYTKYSLGSTLSRYKVAASLNTTSVTSNISPTFSWNAQGGSTYFPNNRFRLVILDINYNHIYGSGPLYYASNYQIPSSTWNNIKNNYSRVYYYVESYQTDQTSTGPYYSTIKTLYTS